MRKTRIAEWKAKYDPTGNIDCELYVNFEVPEADRKHVLQRMKIALESLAEHWDVPVARREEKKAAGEE